MNLIEQTIGSDAFERLIAWAGGTEYVIPSSIESPHGHRLAEVIGLPEALRLIQWGGGDRVYVIAGWDRIRRARADDIMRLHEGGLSAREISIAYNYVGRYTERQIRSILRGRKSAEALPSTEGAANRRPCAA